LAGLLAYLVLSSGCGQGAPEDQGKSALIRRVDAALVELGASSPLTHCLTINLGRHLTESDPEAAFEDFSSEPEVSEKALNRASLLERAVKAHLLSRGPQCRSFLISRDPYPHAKIDGMLRRVGQRGYQNPDFFTPGSEPGSQP
jgi:hypothetical protein